MEDQKQHQGNISTNMHNKNWFDKYYKLLMLIPVILVVLSLVYLGTFHQKNHEFIFKDVSLSGGTTITINNQAGNLNIDNLEASLQTKYQNINFRKLTDLRTGEALAVIIEFSGKPEEIQPDIEAILGYKLDEENSSIEFTGSTLSGSFYKQLIIALISAFLLMSAVVFCLFGEKLKYKIILSILTLITIIFLLKMYFIIAIPLSILIFASYIFLSPPSIAVIFAAFSDIVIPLAIIDYLGIRLSAAGIAAFLMLIGYSVDTDILLTTRAIKNREGFLNQRIYRAFKTGILMTITALFSVLPAFFIVTGLPDSFRQIFLILALGLFADIFNTWLTNAGIIKWYCQKKGIT